MGRIKKNKCYTIFNYRLFHYKILLRMEIKDFKIFRKRTKVIRFNAIDSIYWMTK